MLPLEGVGVYVDVRSSDGKANYSKCVSEQLQMLGADIKTTLTNQCSHVVFKDGKVNTRILANKLGATFVNVLWVERCRESNRRCNEADFPVTEERVETPINLRKTKPRYRSMQPAANLEASKGKKKRVKRDSSVAASDSPAPLNPLKERLNRKLQWPPDHSDVCSEAELAAHDEITEDMKQVKTKGKRKLKRSAVFNDSATEKSQCKKSISATDLFVLAKTPATSTKHTSCTSAQEKKDPIQEEDSLLSLYDASQHFERKDYSVTNMINRIDATIDTFDGQSPKGEFDDLYSDSDPDFFTSPTSKLKRRCELTKSQTNIMNTNFNFDEVDSEIPTKKPKATRKRKQSKTNTKIESAKSSIYEKERSAGSILDSPEKLLTFNSNFTDASDIVTDLEAGTGKEENLVIDQIKSPAIVKESKRKSTRKSNYGTKTKKPHLPVQVAIKSKPKVIDEQLDELPSFGLLDDDSPPLLVAPPDDDDSPSVLIRPNGDESPPQLIPPMITNSTINVLEKDDVRQSRKSISTKGRNISEGVISTAKTTTKDQITLLQEHTISSTSEGKENVSQNSRRRVSQRIKNTSSLLNNPDFVYTHIGNIQSSDNKIKRKPSIASIPEETRVKLTSKRNSKRESNRPDLKERDVHEGSRTKLSQAKDVPVDTKPEKRRSSRQCRSNIRLSEISDKTDTGKIKMKPEINETPCDQSITRDQSITSELSTTETPNGNMRKPVRTLKKSEIKRPVNVATTTDTEGSSSELNNKHGRRLKKTKKVVKESLDVSISAPPRQSMSPVKKICTTCCHRDDQGMVRNTAKMLSAIISETVTPDTTHVVVGTVKRTINLLKGIIHGAHVVSLSWVTESISSGSWQRETRYSLVKEYPVLKKGGEVRRGLATRLFTGIGLVFVEKHTSPPCSEITDLIELCGGKITKSRTRSKYCIGGAAQDKQHISLSEQWVLDTITKLKLQDSNQYLLFPYRSPSPEF